MATQDNYKKEVVKAQQISRTADDFINGEVKVNFNCFDNAGRFDIVRLVRLGVGMFLLTLLTSLFLYYIYVAFIKYDFNPFANTDNFLTYLTQMFKWFFVNTGGAIGLTDFKVLSEYNYLWYFTLTVSTILIFLFRKSQILKAKFQKALFSQSLEQYFIKSFDLEKREFIYELLPNGKDSFDNFMSNQEGFCQQMGYPSMKAKRIGSNRVLVQFRANLPTLEEMKEMNLKVKDFLREGKIFLGIGVPDIGEKFDKKDLINGKYIPRYLDFHDLPSGSVNLGTSGMGKTVTAEQFQASIFKNFHLMSEFNHVDFKGGIANNFFNLIEEKAQTGKIHIFGNNLVDTYKLFRRLDFMNKARMKYLKDNYKDKFTVEAVGLVIDELAELFDFKAKTKEQEKMVQEIKGDAESLHRTFRSQNFKALESTQSFYSTSSGLTAGIKNNLQLRIMHGLGSEDQVNSVKPLADLLKLGINPTQFNIGRNVIINEAKQTIEEVRSIYMSEKEKIDLYTELLIESKSKKSETIDLTKWYIDVYKEEKAMAEELHKKSGKEEEEEIYYTFEEILEDLGVDLEEHKIEKEEPKKEEKPKEEPKNSKPTVKANIKVKPIKKIEKASKEEADKFFEVSKEVEKAEIELKDFEKEDKEIENSINAIKVISKSSGEEKEKLIKDLEEKIEEEKDLDDLILD